MDEVIFRLGKHIPRENKLFTNLQTNLLRYAIKAFLAVAKFTFCSKSMTKS